jgi:methyltransferase
VTVVLAAAAIIFMSMIAEAAVSRRHERRLRASGAVEPGGDVYAAMQLAYPGAFLLMLAEGAWRAPLPGQWLAAGAVLFAAAKVLKYWAILTLGVRWTFRVLVPPQSARIVRGPYRWLRHPNYVAVAGELAATAIAMKALLTAPFAVGGFLLLMWRRVRVEENALARG